MRLTGLLLVRRTSCYSATITATPCRTAPHTHMHVSCPTSWVVANLRKIGWGMESRIEQVSNNKNIQKLGTSWVRNVNRREQHEDEKNCWWFVVAKDSPHCFPMESELRKARKHWQILLNCYKYYIVAACCSSLSRLSGSSCCKYMVVVGIAGTTGPQTLLPARPGHPFLLASTALTFCCPLFCDARHWTCQSCMSHVGICWKAANPITLSSK